MFEMQMVGSLLLLSVLRDWGQICTGICWIMAVGWDWLYYIVMKMGAGSVP